MLTRILLIMLFYLEIQPDVRLDFHCPLSFQFADQSGSGHMVKICQIHYVYVLQPGTQE